ncbi:MAG: ATP-dependent sacrificial sulfur transferase LarE, partial [Candidatus Hydrothermarchaeaceae archaeon]
EWFEDKEGVVVAFSGGVDSSVVAKAAALALDDNAVAATAKSATLPRSELEMAVKTAEEIGIRHVVFDEDEFENPGFVENSPMRCYHCREGLVSGLKNVAQERGMSLIVDGANADDVKQHRPGLKSMRENDVRSPLMELGMGKEAVRGIAGHFGLSVRDKPSMACLASRIPYGERITREKLAMVERAEDYLHGLGLKSVRVRNHSGVARIEVSKEEISKIVYSKDEVARHLKEIGFTYVALDLEGYRSGSMDEVLE